MPTVIALQLGSRGPHLALHPIKSLTHSTNLLSLTSKCWRRLSRPQEEEEVHAAHTTNVRLALLVVYKPLRVNGDLRFLVVPFGL
jgi:hypothetical protein